MSIRDAVVIKASLPAKELKLVLAWSEIHKEELEQNWLSAKEHVSFTRIEPLR